MRTPIVTTGLFMLAMLAAPLSHAQLLSVDINGQTRSQDADPLFTPWFMAPDITGGKTATRSFTNFVYTYDPL